MQQLCTSEQALQRLKEGNQRFVEGAGRAVPAIHSAEHVAGQQPFAVILGCSDSRVPAELIFDLGFGDLFVIRIAGNVVAPSQIGSIEFAVERFGTPLVVVLGHSHCGAVAATLEQIVTPSELRSRNLTAIVDRIRPAVEVLVEENPDVAPDILMPKAVRSNVRVSVNHLRHGSEIIENLVTAGTLSIVGAEYSLETGHVEFF